MAVQVIGVPALTDTYYAPPAVRVAWQGPALRGGTLSRIRETLGVLRLRTGVDSAGSTANQCLNPSITPLPRSVEQERSLSTVCVSPLLLLLPSSQHIHRLCATRRVGQAARTPHPPCSTACGTAAVVNERHPHPALTRTPDLSPARRHRNRLHAAPWYVRCAACCVPPNTAPTSPKTLCPPRSLPRGASPLPPCPLSTSLSRPQHTAAVPCCHAVRHHSTHTRSHPDLPLSLPPTATTAATPARGCCHRPAAGCSWPSAWPRPASCGTSTTRRGRQSTWVDREGWGGVGVGGGGRRAPGQRRGRLVVVGRTRRG